MWNHKSTLGASLGNIVPWTQSYQSLSVSSVSFVSSVPWASSIINIISVIIYWVVILSEVSINLDVTHQIPRRKTPSCMHPNQICQGGEAALPYSEYLLYHPGSETWQYRDAMVMPKKGDPSSSRVIGCAAYILFDANDCVCVLQNNHLDHLELPPGMSWCWDTRVSNGSHSTWDMGLSVTIRNQGKNWLHELCGDDPHWEHPRSRSWSEVLSGFASGGRERRRNGSGWQS